MSVQVKHSLVSAVAAVPEFAALDDRMLLRVVGASANLVWPAKSVIFEKASEAEALYIILTGRVEIVDDVDGNERVIAILDPGDFFGELSILLDTTHSKTARALEDTELIVLPRDSFQELLTSNADLAAHVRRKLETRRAAPEAGELT
jgi:CRP/FNR family transcriptional regulator, cyclic AMP receptor protein